MAQGTMSAGSIRGQRGIRVFHLLVGLTVGGVERQLLGILPRTNRLGFHNTVYSLKGWGVVGDLFSERGIPAASLDGKGRWDARVLCALLEVIRRGRPQVLCCYTTRANWAGILAGRIAGVPVVVASVREVRSWLSPLERLMDRWLLSLADGMVVPSGAVRDQELRMRSMRPERLWIIPNGVDLDLFRPIPGRGPERRRKNDPPKEAKRVGYLGRLEEPVKGIGTLLDSFRIVLDREPDARLLIAGKGPSEQRLRDKAVGLGLGEAVQFMGEVMDTPAFLRSLDVLVLPSMREGCPNVVLEAMATGVPVVATWVEGTSDLLIHGETGWLVPHGEVDRLAEGIMKMLREEVRAMKIAAGAMAWVREKRPIERTASSYGRLWRRLLEGKIALSGRNEGKGADPSSFL